MISPFSLAPGLDAFPILHGKAPFAMAVRKILWEKRYDSLALGFPSVLEHAALEAVDRLPEIHAVVIAAEDRCAAFFPADPGDGFVEGIRQARARRMALRFWGGNERLRKPLRYLLPDAYLLPALGSQAYRDLAAQAMGAAKDVETCEAASRAHDVFRAWRREGRRGSTLLLCDFPLFLALEKIFGDPIEQTLAEASRTSEDFTLARDGWTTRVLPVRPNQLYFALGELPFYAGVLEEERQNPWKSPRPYLDLIKSLFIGTRSAFPAQDRTAQAATVKKVQTALTFTRNLAAMEGRVTPGLLDLVAAARGVFGHAFAAKLLETARTYPYSATTPEACLEVGRDHIRLPDSDHAESAFNLCADEPKVWKTIRLHRDPDARAQSRYRYAWDARGFCSHVPEDIRIERFNQSARKRSRDMLFQGEAQSEPLTASLKDGIDLRETLRSFAVTGRIHVRETPLPRGQIDTIVVLFDTDHDDLYPYRMAWAYEHAEESMLTFYATDPFGKMVGPGIVRAEFGGFSLLFPPRPVPDVFQLPAAEFGFRNHAEQLLYGALRHSGQRTVSLVSAARPNLRMRRLASEFRRRLVWVPLASYSAETLARLRRFHVLNGQKVRAWATRFIPD